MISHTVLLFDGNSGTFPCMQSAGGLLKPAFIAGLVLASCNSAAPASPPDTFDYEAVHALCDQVISETLDDSFIAVLPFQIDGQFTVDESLTNVQVFGDESLLNDPAVTSCGAVSTDEPERLRALVLVKLPGSFYVRVGTIT